MNKNLQPIIPWILLIFFIVLQLLVIIILIYFCSKFWKSISIKFSTKEKVTKKSMVQDPSNFYKKTKNRDIKNIEEFDFEVTNIENKVFSILPESTANVSIKNIDSCGSLDILVRFGLIERIVTLTLLKIEKIPFKENGVTGKIHIVCFSFPIIQCFENVINEYPIKHPWSINFNLKYLKPQQEMYFVYITKIVESKNRSTYLGSSVINLSNFFSNNSYHDGLVTTNISNLPQDLLFINKSLLILKEDVDLSKPSSIISLLYNTNTGRLEINCNKIHLPKMNIIPQRDIKCSVKIFDETGKSIGEAKILKIKKNDSEERKKLRAGSRNICFVLPYQSIKDCTLLVNYMLKKSSKIKINQKQMNLYDSKKIGYVSLGKYSSHEEALEHWKLMSQTPNSESTKYHKLIY